MLTVNGIRFLPHVFSISMYCNKIVFYEVISTVPLSCLLTVAVDLEPRIAVCVCVCVCVRVRVRAGAGASECMRLRVCVSRLATQTHTRTHTNVCGFSDCCLFRTVYLNDLQ